MVLITDLLERKRDGESLTAEEIRSLVMEIASGEVADYQAGAFLMAAYLNGLDPEETLALTGAMRDSGEVISWKDGLHPLADKHSTGGVGDKVSLVLAPLAASIGLRVPMISGRSLGHTGGTLDKLESIPGFDVNLTIPRFKELVELNGLCMIGQTDSLAPADRKLYALRDATSTVTSIPLICASILSKKLAENPDILVFDVKCGSGAFMKSREEAVRLAEELVRISKMSGKKAAALVTSMNFPLGLTAGNALEVQEALDVLRGRGPADTTELTIRLVNRMAELACISGGSELCAENIRNGTALEYFIRMTESQGGDLAAFEAMPRARHILEVRADRTGYWMGPDALTVGRAVRKLGGGRFRMDDEIDPLAGWEQEIPCGSPVENGAILGRVHAADASAAEEAAAAISAGFSWDRPSDPLVIMEVE